MLDEPAAILRSGLAELGLQGHPELESGLLAFLALLSKWNRVYNLTAIRDPAEMVRRHLLDSLSVAPWLAGPHVLDVGTGPGLPGIPLALACPNLPFILLDSNGKKLRFVRQAVAELGLDNVQVVQARIQDYVCDPLPGQILARAFAPLSEILERCGHCLVGDARLLAMKGPAVDEELQDLGPGFVLVAQESLPVPGLNANHRLVIIGRQALPPREANHHG